MAARAHRASPPALSPASQTSNPQPTTHKQPLPLIHSQEPSQPLLVGYRRPSAPEGGVRRALSTCDGFLLAPLHAAAHAAPLAHKQPRPVPATTSDELMTHTALLYVHVIDIYVFEYMYVWLENGSTTTFCSSRMVEIEPVIPHCSECTRV